MRTKTQTITDNLSLFKAHNEACIKKMRREMRSLKRQIWWSRIKQFMNKIKTAAMLLAGMVALVGQVKAYPVIVEAQRGPESPITLTNGVPQVVTSVHLPCKGKWTISGGATVQTNVANPTSWAFLYTAAAFTLSQSEFPVDGRAALDARPDGTWWFSADPRTHTILVDYDGATVYLLVECYGQVPADYMQAFGSIIATIDIR